ncbi:uncharacterized protein FOMMEDRAFT_79656 [Fomitiporia mediterranea MF3/22]|uniref:uncharacterized protein n=1 Tax=Fomitiporia mediterranea (strain MF3/22) TaxID=694068 RepID=UPI0004407617|nr:uncharacterized protein FOMMEDRAFT_79656 [Fomitiporia mediterranea MF3/22]EJD05405.1 hypothetical protein FOMMEDRAFT_79656 [Fomitiporia mediterranea MF3/22]
MQWQTVPVDGDGTKLGYIDSGAPPTSSYTTVVLVHGHTFNAPVFSRLLPLAQQNDLRLIALNQRDYVNSTPFADAELDILSSNDEVAHMNFFRARGLEYARFLCWVIKELNIPRLDPAESSGGLAFLGWSLGNLTTIAFLAYLDSCPPEIIQTLKPYLKSFFIYGAPHMFLGYPIPPGTYNPFYVPENPMRIAPLSFASWVSAYYKHPADSESGSTVTPDAFIQHEPEKHYRPCTTDTMSTDELSMTLDLTPNARSERFYFDMSFPMLHNMLEKALLGANNSPLPNMKVYYIFGLEDIWLIHWAAVEFKKDLAKWEDERKDPRPIKVIPVAEANHFVSCDTGIIGSLSCLLMLYHGRYIGTTPRVSWT